MSSVQSQSPTVAGLQLNWREFGPASGIRFGLWVLEDPDAPLDLLTDEEFQSTDERMPYFGHIWASAEALVSYLLAGPTLAAKRVLDLGCGLGPCGFAARARGAAVTFLDWEPRALSIVEASARAQPGPAAPSRFIVGDWRSPPSLGPFDLILGADLLYEARNAPAVVEFIARHLDVEGEAWIADPGRLHAGRIPELAERAHLQLRARARLPHPDDTAKITLLRLALSRGQSAGSEQDW